MGMTQTQTTTRTEYATVRPGMTVTTYSGEPIEVTAVRFVLRLLDMDRGWTPTVVLSGRVGWWAGDMRHVENCYQLPHGRTRLIDDKGAQNRFWVTIDDDAAMHRTAHNYSTRYVELDTNIRI